MYEIKVLRSDEFDRVAKSDPRYSYVDETNLGFADRLKNIAYVRGTHVHELNKYLIEHELEELEQAESVHEDPNGIRHKKFWDFIKSWFSPITTMAGIASNPFGSIFGGSKQQEQPQMQSGSYEPQQASSGQSGGFGSPMNLFQGEPTSGSYTPGASATVPGSASGLGNLGGGLTDETMKNLRAGNYAGRLTF